jgi:hypothetical protein
MALNSTILYHKTLLHFYFFAHSKQFIMEQFCILCEKMKRKSKRRRMVDFTCNCFIFNRKASTLPNNIQIILLLHYGPIYHLNQTWPDISYDAFIFLEGFYFFLFDMHYLGRITCYGGCSFSTVLSN